MKHTGLGTDMDHKEKTKTEKESDLNDCTKDLAATQNELDAALACARGRAELRQIERETRTM